MYHNCEQFPSFNVAEREVIGLVFFGYLYPYKRDTMTYPFSYTWRYTDQDLHFNGI